MGDKHRQPVSWENEFSFLVPVLSIRCQVGNGGGTGQRLCWSEIQHETTPITLKYSGQFKPKCCSGVVTSVLPSAWVDAFIDFSINSNNPSFAFMSFMCCSDAMAGFFGSGSCLFVCGCFTHKKICFLVNEIKQIDTNRN